MLWRGDADLQHNQPFEFRLPVLCGRRFCHYESSIHLQPCRHLLPLQRHLLRDEDQPPDIQPPGQARSRKNSFTIPLGEYLLLPHFTRCSGLVLYVTEFYDEQCELELL